MHKVNLGKDDPFSLAESGVWERNYVWGLANTCLAWPALDARADTCTDQTSLVYKGAWAIQTCTSTSSAAQQWCQYIPVVSESYGCAKVVI